MNTSLAAVAALALTVGLTGFSSTAMAAEKAQPRDLGLTCQELTDVGEQYAGSLIYYVKGHYDAQKGVWTDYGPKSKTATVDGVEDFYLPVENIFEYCSANPQATVVKALSEYPENLRRHHD